MTTPRACALLLLTLISVQTWASEVVVDVRNALSACAAVKVTRIAEQANMVLATADFQLQSSIAACGCRSALASYESVVSVSTAEQVLQRGVIKLDTGGSQTVALASAPGLIPNNKVQLHLTCAPDL